MLKTDISSSNGVWFYVSSCCWW